MDLKSLSLEMKISMNRMRHDSSHFTTSGVTEWLIYSNLSLRGTATFRYVSDDADDATIDLECGWDAKEIRNVNLWLQGFDSRVEVSAKPAANSSWQRKLFGTANIVGDWKAGVESGIFTIDPFDKPILTLTDPNYPARFEAFKAIKSAVSCPLIVSNDDVELVIENYFEMPQKRQMLLPALPDGKTFAGSFRTKKYIGQSFPQILRSIAIIAALTEIYVRPRYMRIDAT